MRRRGAEGGKWGEKGDWEGKEGKKGKKEPGRTVCSAREDHSERKRSMRWQRQVRMRTSNIGMKRGREK